MSDIEELTNGMRRFTDERDWARFHDPKSLVLALVGEVGELAELVQWLPAESAAEMLQEPVACAAVADELADVFLYLVRLADVVHVDLAAAARRKLDINGRRFPPDDVAGTAPMRTSHQGQGSSAST